MEIIDSERLMHATIQLLEHRSALIDPSVAVASFIQTMEPERQKIEAIGLNFGEVCQSFVVLAMQGIAVCEMAAASGKDLRELGESLGSKVQYAKDFHRAEKVLSEREKATGNN